MVDRFGQGYNVGLLIFFVAVNGTKGKLFLFEASSEAKSEGKVGRFEFQLPTP